MTIEDNDAGGEQLLDGLERELQNFGADDLIVFGIRYDDEDELELAIWDSLDDPALLAGMLEDYLVSYRREHGLDKPQSQKPQKPRSTPKKTP